MGHSFAASLGLLLDRNGDDETDRGYTQQAIKPSPNSDMGNSYCGSELAKEKRRQCFH